jgi:hypothetical protein
MFRIFSIGATVSFGSCSEMFIGGGLSLFVVASVSARSSVGQLVGCPWCVCSLDGAAGGPISFGLSVWGGRVRGVVCLLGEAGGVPLLTFVVSSLSCDITTWEVVCLFVLHRRFAFLFCIYSMIEFGVGGFCVDVVCGCFCDWGKLVYRGCNTSNLFFVGIAAWGELPVCFMFLSFSMDRFCVMLSSRFMLSWVLSITLLLFTRFGEGLSLRIFCVIKFAILLLSLVVLGTRIFLLVALFSMFMAGCGSESWTAFSLSSIFLFSWMFFLIVFFDWLNFVYRDDDKCTILSLFRTFVITGCPCVTWCSHCRVLRLVSLLGWEVGPARRDESDSDENECTQRGLRVGWNIWLCYLLLM